MNSAEDIVKEFPYLDLTPELLYQLTEEDPVMNKIQDQIAEFQEKIVKYEGRVSECQDSIEKLIDRRVSLEAELKSVDTEIRELRGASRSDQYHIKLANRRIRDREASINRRRKFLYKSAIQKRLKKLGRDFKLGPGGRKPKSTTTQT